MKLNEQAHNIVVDFVKNVKPVLDSNEQISRLVLSAMAKAIGYGGQTFIHNLTNVPFDTLQRGIEDLKHPDMIDFSRTRVEGGGRKPLTETDPLLLADLNAIMERSTAGNPMKADLYYTAMTLEEITKNLNAPPETLGISSHDVSESTVRRLLKDEGYSLHVNRKWMEGEVTDPEDRDKAIRYINRVVDRFRKNGQPAISIDTKKKENIGNFKQNGREYCKEARKVDAYDFCDSDHKASPYGIYDIQENAGFTNVGVSRDTAEFSAHSIDLWWTQIGSALYPGATRLLITCDGGGSNKSNARQWKVLLQQLADKHQLDITVLHFPVGTSKWNKIEHRYFCHISTQFAAHPLADFETVVQLISRVKTKKGLTSVAVLDKNIYEKGVKVTDEELGNVRIKRHKTNQKLFYTISANRNQDDQIK